MRANQKDVLNRLATIEGHLKGIRKMVEEDQYCVDILKQTFAVERALQKFETAILEGHLNGCVAEGFRDMSPLLDSRSIVRWTPSLIDRLAASTNAPKRTPRVVRPVRIFC